MCSGLSIVAGLVLMLFLAASPRVSVNGISRLCECRSGADFGWLSKGSDPVNASGSIDGHAVLNKIFVVRAKRHVGYWLAVTQGAVAYVLSLAARAAVNFLVDIRGGDGAQILVLVCAKEFEHLVQSHMHYAVL